MNTVTHIAKSVITSTTTLNRSQRKVLLGIETPLDLAIHLHDMDRGAESLGKLVTERQKRRFRHHVARREAAVRRAIRLADTGSPAGAQASLETEHQLRLLRNHIARKAAAANPSKAGRKKSADDPAALQRAA